MAKIDKKILCFLSVIAFFSMATAVSAYVANSANYRIEIDTESIGGGLSTSDNYKVEDALGGAVRGTVTGDSYVVKSGYMSMTDVTISVSLTGSLNLGNISANGGVRTGSAVATVITDNPAGYTLYVSSATSPALKSGDQSFSDYTSMDFTWTVGELEAKFGFSVEGGDTVSSFKDNGTTCGAGSLNTTDACWTGFSTGNSTIAQSSVANQPTGTETTLKIRAEAGTKKGQPEGTYTTTINATAVAN